MTRTEFIAALAAALNDAAHVIITEAEKGVIVDSGVRFYSNVRPRKRRASFTLVADQAAYDELPADFIRHTESEWGASRREYSSYTHPKPWEDGYVARDLPEFRIADEEIYLDPAPTESQITTYGATYYYWYDAAHTVGDASTIPVHDDPIVMLFAEWSAYKELAARPDQAEEFVVRYRKMTEQIEERLRRLLDAPPTILR